MAIISNSFCSIYWHPGLSWREMWVDHFLTYPNIYLTNLRDTTKKDWLEKLLYKICVTQKKITNWKTGNWPVKDLLIDWTRTIHKIFNEKSFSLKGQDPAPTESDKFLKFIFEELWYLPNTMLLKRLESLTLDYFHINSPITPDTIKQEKLDKLIFKIRQMMEKIDTCYFCILAEPVKELLVDWARTVHEIFNEKSFYLKGQDPAPTESGKFIKFIFEKLWPLSNKTLLKRMKDLTLNCKTLLQLKEQDPASTRNDRFIKICFEGLWSLPNFKLQEWLETPTLDDYDNSFHQKVKDPDPTRDDSFNKCISIDFHSSCILNLEEVDTTPTGNDNFRKSSFEELWYLTNIELLEWQKSLKLNVLNLEEVDTTPTGNDNFRKSSFEELWYLTNIELLEWQKSLKLNGEKSFNPKEQYPVLDLIEENLICEDFYSLGIIWIETLYKTFNDDDKSFHQKGKDPDPTRDDCFNKCTSIDSHSSSISTPDFLLFKMPFLRSDWPRVLSPDWPGESNRWHSGGDAGAELLKLQPRWGGIPFNQKEKDPDPKCDDKFKRLESYFVDANHKSYPDPTRKKEKLILQLQQLMQVSHQTLLGFFSGKTKELNKLELITKGASWNKTIIEFIYLSLFLLGSLCGFFTGKTKEVNKSELLTQKRASWSKTCIVYLGLLWLLPVSLCDNYMLSYHHTGLYYPEEDRYHFETVGYVDDQEIDKYSSESRVNIPKTAWMEKNEKDDYWEKQTSLRSGWEKVFKDNLMILASRFNYTRSSHTLQLSYGCAVYDNGITGYYRYGFDGKDFLIFDQNTLLWTPSMQKAEISAQRWNSDSEIGKGVNFYLTEHCASALMKYVGYGREELERKVRPEVKVWGHRQMDDVTRLQCLVYGFHPRLVEVKWMRNEEDHILSDEMTPTLPHPDGTYQIRVSVEVPTMEGDTYSCHVDHSSLEDILSVRWEPGHNGISTIIAIGVLVAVIVLVTVVTVIVLWKKKLGTKTVTREGNRPTKAFETPHRMVSCGSTPSGNCWEEKRKNCY